MNERVGKIYLAAALIYNKKEQIDRRTYYQIVKHKQPTVIYMFLLYFISTFFVFFRFFQGLFPFSSAEAFSLRATIPAFFRKKIIRKGIKDVFI